MNKKQRNRKNQKREIRVNNVNFGDRTVRFVDVELLMKVGGKTYAGKRIHYGRSQSTSACDLEQLASIIMMWEKIVIGGSTYADDFLREAEGKIENRSGLTADEIFRKHWVNFRETIDEEFDRKNKGIPGQLWCEHENDYIMNTTALALDGFDKDPMPCKLAFLYGIMKLYYKGNDYDELKRDMDSLPQYLRGIVDKMINDEKKEV